jgi:hypothetical protein
VKRTLTLALALIAGCRQSPAGPAEDPREIRLVAILPFFDETGNSSFDGEAFGAILASEFVKASGVRAIRPAQIRAALNPGEQVRSVDDAIRVARRLGADTVLACAVTDYDPYDPPRLAVHAQLLRAESRAMSAEDVDRLIQSASWQRGPLAMSRDRAGHALAAFEAVYDARDRNTRKLLTSYAERTSTRESEFLAIQPRYLEFVSNQIIVRTWELAHQHGT